MGSIFAGRKLGSSLMDDDSQPSKAQGRFLLYLLEEYKRGFGELPTVCNELCEPISTWYLQTEIETEGRRVN
jgi:hypothetical protein